MRFLVPLALLLVSPLAIADVVADCRAAHAGDPAAHIACLEHALRPGGDAKSVVEARPAESPQGAAPPTRAAAAAPAGLGSEQVRKRQRALDAPPEKMNVQIASVRYNAEGRGIFTMADGQVWLETETTPAVQRLKPGSQYSARIETGRIGGYRMYVDGVRRMIKLERVK